MADIVFNIAKGRVAELAGRVETNDPANSALVVVALKAAGLEDDATLQDYDTLGALLAASSDEATNAGYARKILTEADLAAVASDDVNNRMPVALPEIVWTAVQAAGGAWGKLLVCYDPDTTTGTDADLVPLTAHDYAITPDGSDRVLPAGDFFRAS